MGFLFHKPPKPLPPPNPAQPAAQTNPFADPMRSGSSFIGGGADGLTVGRKVGQKTSLIGGG